MFSKRLGADGRRVRLDRVRSAIAPEPGLQCQIVDMVICTCATVHKAVTHGRTSQ